MHQDKKISNGMKIVFFGGRHTHDIIWQLRKNFDLALVVTPDRGTVKFVVSEEVPYIQTLSLNSKLTSEIKKLKPDLGVVADFGLIIPQSLIDVFPHGIINIHPSLLPKYRGPTPVQTAILNGDKKTGISIIKLDDQIDHGPIIHQEEYAIAPDDYSDKLLIKIFAGASKILPNVIKKYSANPGDLIEQDDKKATYTKTLTKEDGYIDPENPPEKRKLRRMINALNPWPGVWTRLRLSSCGQAKIIKLLPDSKIQVEGKRPMSYKDFINGYANGEKFLRAINLISN